MKSSWLELLWLLLIPVGLIFAFCHAYSCALLRALGSARDEQHRMTPRDPWYFFDREFSAAKQSLTYRLIIMLSAATIVNRLPSLLDRWNEATLLLTMFVSYTWLGMTGFSTALITLLVPWINSASWLSAISLGVTLFLWATYCLFPTYWIMLALALLLLWPLIGIVSYFLVWRYVRGRLQDLWFRFEE